MSSSGATVSATVSDPTGPFVITGPPSSGGILTGVDATHAQFVAPPTLAQLPAGRVGWYGDGDVGGAVPGGHVDTWTSTLDDGAHYPLVPGGGLGSTHGPTLIAGTDPGAPNGRKFVRFAGNTPQGLGFASLNNQYVIAVVSYATALSDGDASAGPTLVGWGGGSTHGWRLVKVNQAWMTAPGNDYQYRNGLAAPPVSGTNAVDLYPLSGWQIWERIYPPGDGANNMWLDWPDADGTGKYWNGDLAMLLVINHAPTIAERRTTLAALANYYGIGVTLP